MAQWLGVAKTRVTVAQGSKSRVKTLDIDGEPGELETLIAARVAALAVRREIARHDRAQRSSTARRSRRRCAARWPPAWKCFKRERGATPGLAVVLVGEDPASQVYVRTKARQTREAGMASFEHKLDAATAEAALAAA